MSQIGGGNQPGNPVQPDPPTPVPDTGPAQPRVACGRRLRDAERRAVELEQRVTELESSLERARRDLTGAERRRELERLLTEAHAVDVEAARLLAETTMGGDQAEPAEAVEQLRRDRPHLFRADPPGLHARPGAAMTPETPGAEHDELEALAREARASGDRRALLAYLRRRRGAPAA